MMRTLRWSAVALACLLASGCKRNEPVKPIATPPSATFVIFIDY
ncbi:hypothetical protein [Massilia niabensis]|uniref:Uncharacterized protein n=1 Tax=Massilia niabensis TaxID=544910 RepID=A0ABW0L2M1_9BURK